LIILLDLDEDTLLTRLRNREKKYGKSPDEQKRILKWREEIPAEWEGYGARVIDAVRPIKDVTEDILGICKEL